MSAKGSSPRLTSGTRALDWRRRRPSGGRRRAVCSPRWPRGWSTSPPRSSTSTRSAASAAIAWLGRRWVMVSADDPTRPVGAPRRLISGRPQKIPGGAATRAAFPGFFRDAGTCRNHLQRTFDPMINQTADSGQGVSDPRKHRFHPKPRLTQGRRPGGRRPRPARDLGRHLARPRRLPREQARLVPQSRRRPFRPPPAPGWPPATIPLPAGSRGVPIPSPSRGLGDRDESPRARQVNRSRHSGLPGQRPVMVRCARDAFILLARFAHDLPRDAPSPGTDRAVDHDPRRVQRADGEAGRAARVRRRSTSPAVPCRPAGRACPTSGS